MGYLLIFIGTLLLLVCLTGIGLGVYMAADARNRSAGGLFAVWWVSGAAGAVGIIMRDGVTFLVGLLCFAVAGAAYLLSGDAGRPPKARTRGGTRSGSRGGVRSGIGDASEKTTRENRSGYRRAAS